MSARTILPKVIVWDWDWSDGPLATHYFSFSASSEDNEIDFGAVWKQIKSLKRDPGRGRIDYAWSADGDATVPILLPCTTDFHCRFFECLAILLNYYADFFPHDTCYMQRQWWNLVQHVQRAAVLPHQWWHDARNPHGAKLYCEHAAWFNDTYDQTLVLLNRVILARDPRAKADVVTHRDPFSFRPSYHVGKFKTGLTAWQQFFLNGSPGFQVPAGERKYEAPYAQMEGKVCERHVPMGALAVVDRHVQRAREMAEEIIAASNLDTVDAARFLGDFDSKTITPHTPATYTSLTGHLTTIQPMHPSQLSRAAPRINYEGFLDANLYLAEPTLPMLDEAVGSYMGIGEYVHPLGNEEFRMATVTAGRESGEPPVEGLGREVLGDLFDEWV